MQVVGSLGLVLELLTYEFLEHSGSPGAHQRGHAHVHLLHVHHAASRHGGGRGYLQVLHLEEHVQGGRQLDTLRVSQTQRLVVITQVHGVVGC